MFNAGKVAAKSALKGSHYPSVVFAPLTRHRRTAIVANPLSSIRPFLSTSSFSSSHALYSIAALSAGTIGAATDFPASTLSSPHEPPLMGSCGIAKARPSEPPSQQRSPAGLVGQAGEDAFFIAANGCAWGIADGVGGWASHPGADSARYSRTLMTHALNAADDGGTKTPSLPSPPTPLAILEAAYRATQKLGIVGSSTACVVTWDSQLQRVSYANLGDSGVLLLRAPPASPPSRRSSYERAEERQHSFNCPYQLGHASGDRPSDAALATFDVSEGDLLLLYTDGLVDNLSPEEILRAVDDFSAHTPVHHPSTPSPFSSTASLDGLARALCDRAHEAARDPKRETPFSRNCRRAGKHFRGGKMDDISVVVVQFGAKKSEEAGGEKSARSKL